MGEVESYTCPGCPIGCAREIEHEGAEIIEVRGNRCERGTKCARQEFTDPRRALRATVAIDGARRLHGLRVAAPVRLGDVLVADFLGEAGVAAVATRTMEPAG